MNSFVKNVDFTKMSKFVISTLCFFFSEELTMFKLPSNQKQTIELVPSEFVPALKLLNEPKLMVDFE